MKAFITGASSGIGAALAREVARSHPGSCIGMLARRLEPLESLGRSLPDSTCVPYAVDVTNTHALRAAAHHFIEHFGVPDVVIANAGISAGTSAADADRADVTRRIVAVNLHGLIDTLGAFAAPMVARGSGALVGVTSVAGLRGMPGASAYCASKAGASTYLESMRVELRGTGVRVQTLLPGFVRTPMTAVNPFPMPFLMSPEDFARQALQAIEAGVAVAIIPWQFRVVAPLMRLMPTWLFDRLAMRAPRKPST